MNRYPLQVRARPDAPGRSLWLVKWLLLIPQYIVLAVLWVAFVVLTVVAYIAVLFTGRYPSDVVGDPASCVFDAGLTQADGTLVKIFGCGRAAAR